MRLLWLVKAVAGRSSWVAVMEEGEFLMTGNVMFGVTRPSCKRLPSRVTRRKGQVTRDRIRRSPTLVCSSAMMIDSRLIKRQE